MPFHSHLSPNHFGVHLLTGIGLLTLSLLSKENSEREREREREGEESPQKSPLEH